MGGNYSAFTVARELELQRQQQLYVTQQKEIARLEEAVRRFEEWAHRVVDERHIKQARNKQRQIDRMEKIDRPVLERRKIALELHPHARGGERVLALRGVSRRRSTFLRRAAPISEGEAVSRLMTFLFTYEQVRRPLSTLVHRGEVRSTDGGWSFWRARRADVANAAR